MSERGLSESTQWALLVPLLMTMVLGTIQVGILMHGRTVASNAALAAAEQVAWARAGEAGAREAARRVARAGGVVDLNVGISRTNGVVQVTVTGRVPTFFDVGQGRLREVAVLPVEVTR